MNQKVLHTLEYDKIISRLTKHAGSFLGKKACQELEPITDFHEIQILQQETQDALNRIYKNGSVSFGGIHDVTPSLMRLEVGATLGMEELLCIASLLEAALRVKNYGNANEEKEQEPDSLAGYFSGLAPLSPLAQEINRCIISPEEMSDQASPGLSKIRRSVKAVNGKIHDQLSSMMGNQNTRTMLQDSLITMRSGRYCLPVKAEYKNQIPGMVHDQSSTGSTLFIEPMSIVKLNNELRELASQEKEEIEKVLAALSASCFESIEDIRQDLTLLGTLDFAFAKGLFAREIKGSMPVFHSPAEHAVIDLKKARHPLIDPHKVVPIDIRLGDSYDLLIITGPNTGGKTVSLKTLGLLTLMGQSGLFIPAMDGSRLSIFEEVYADIGDEQSIEQSLSTFSSHMTNTIDTLKQADEHSLCLFDELGAGTDPAEGAALAISILSYLHGRGIRTMATTHYSELKIFALSTEGVENGSCEFDVASLRPTYRLLIGIPGKSNAFAISSRLGLPDHIIDDARKRIDSQSQDFEDVIADLEQSRITIEQERAQIASYKEEIKDLRQKLTKKNEKIDEAKERILRNANEQASEILQKAKDYADETIKKYNRWQKDGNASKEMEQERNRLRERMKETDSHLGIKPKKPKKKSNKSSDFHIGDDVLVLSMNLKGTVSTLPNEKGDLFVQMGILRSQVHISDLELLPDESTKTSGKKNKNRSGSGNIRMSKSSSVRPEINIIGKTVDEGIAILEKYLDDAYLAGLPQVTIIHGRGTGALRAGVHQFLKGTSYVKSFRVGEFGEGDHGVTIVEFK
ncbi:MAG: endonuclease MutS2 [Clostridiales bacterium]|nr:endonuclease MutS2 [Clostridiales bacterium]